MRTLLSFIFKSNASDQPDNPDEFNKSISKRLSIREPDFKSDEVGIPVEWHPSKIGVIAIGSHNSKSVLLASLGAQKYSRRTSDDVHFDEDFKSTIRAPTFSREQETIVKGTERFLEEVYERCEKNS